MISLTFLGALALAVQQDSMPRDSVVQLEEVVVTASRSREVSRRDQPLAIMTVRPDLATRASSRIAVDMLRDAIGVQVQQTSAGQGAIILRGLLGNQVLLLVDGVPLNNGTYRDGPGQYLATIDPESIERIEIARGPASVLYGSDAQGGVVNVITRPHMGDEPGVRAAGHVSSANNSFRSRASVALGTRRLRAEFGGSVTHAGDLRAGGSVGRQDPTDFGAVGFDGRLTFEPNRRHRLIASVQHYRMNDVDRYDRLVDFRSPVGAGRDIDHRFDPQTRQLGYVDYRVRFPSRIIAQLEATTSLVIQRETRIRQRRTSTGLADPRVETWSDNVYTPGVSLVGLSVPRLGSIPLTLTWGAEYYRDLLDARGTVRDTESGIVAAIERRTALGAIPSGRFPDAARSSRFGTYVQAEAEVTRYLLVQAGGRWSRIRSEAEVGLEFGGPSSNTSSDLTGQIGVVLTPAEPWRFALRVAEGFRAPNLYDLTNVGPIPQGIVLPNPDARPENSLSIETSARFATRRAAFEVTVYRTRIDDFLDRAPSVFQDDTLFQGERVYQGLNLGAASVRGLEAEAATNFGALRLRATLQYTHGTQKRADGTEEPMAKIPPLGGTGRAHWEIPGLPAWIEYGARWASAQRRLSPRDESDSRIAPGGTDGFLVHSVYAGADVTDELALSAGLENLTDALYRDHASGTDNPGRHLWIGLSWLRAF